MFVFAVLFWLGVVVLFFGVGILVLVLSFVFLFLGYEWFFLCFLSLCDLFFCWCRLVSVLVF